MKGSRNLICRLQLMNSSKVGNIVKKRMFGPEWGWGRGSDDEDLEEEGEEEAFAI